MKFLFLQPPMIIKIGLKLIRVIQIVKYNIQKEIMYQNLWTYETSTSIRYRQEDNFQLRNMVSYESLQEKSLSKATLCNISPQAMEI